jgi:hypothetical protein
LGVIAFRSIRHWQSLRVKQSGTPIRKENLVFPDTSHFQHFFELKPGETMTEHPDWLDHPVTYTVTQQGFNERMEYPKEKQSWTYRIITLGDSFTFGEYVNTPDNYSETLEKLLNGQRCRETSRFDVINLGIAGYDIGYEAEHFIRQGRDLHPDLVIWLMNGFNFYQMRDLSMTREAEIDAAMTPDQRKKMEEAKDYYASANQAMHEVMDTLGKEKILAQQEVYLKRFAEVYDGPLVISLFGDLDEPDILALVNRFVASRPNTYLFRGLPAIQSLGATWPDGHPNELGHRLIAGNMFAYLFAERLYPCTP